MRRSFTSTRRGIASMWRSAASTENSAAGTARGGASTWRSAAWMERGAARTRRGDSDWRRYAGAVAPMAVAPLWRGETSRHTCDALLNSLPLAVLECGPLLRHRRSHCVDAGRRRR